MINHDILRAHRNIFLSDVIHCSTPWEAIQGATPKSKIYYEQFGVGSDSTRRAEHGYIDFAAI